MRPFEVLVLVGVVYLLFIMTTPKRHGSSIARVPRASNALDPFRKKNLSDKRVKEFSKQGIEYWTANFVRCGPCDELIPNEKSWVEKHIYKDRKTKKEFRAGHAQKCQDAIARKKTNKKGQRQMVCTRD